MPLQILDLPTGLELSWSFEGGGLLVWISFLCSLHTNIERMKGLSNTKIACEVQSFNIYSNSIEQKGETIYSWVSN